MKKLNIKELIITCSACLLPIIIGIAVYNKLPDTVALQFGLNQDISNSIPKGIFVFGMPIVMAFLQSIYYIKCSETEDTDKALEKNKKMKLFFIPVISVVLYVILIINGLK